MKALFTFVFLLASMIITAPPVFGQSEEPTYTYGIAQYKCMQPEGNILQGSAVLFDNGMALTAAHNVDRCVYPNEQWIVLPGYDLAVLMEDESMSIPGNIPFQCHQPQTGDIVGFGGYPGVLRDGTENRKNAQLEYAIGVVTENQQVNIVRNPTTDNLHAYTGMSVAAGMAGKMVSPGYSGGIVTTDKGMFAGITLARRSSDSIDLAYFISAKKICEVLGNLNIE